MYPSVVIFNDDFSNGNFDLNEESIDDNFDDNGNSNISPRPPLCCLKLVKNESFKYFYRYEIFGNTYLKFG